MAAFVGLAYAVAPTEHVWRAVAVMAGIVFVLWLLSSAA